MSNETLLPTDTRITVLQKPLEERLHLSRTQEAKVREFAIRYMQQHHIDYTRSNLGSTIGVLAIDALLRGLTLVGKIEIKDDDNVSKLIGEGLKQREGIKAQAEQILGETLTDAQVSGQEFIGPFALNRNIILGAAREQRTFHTSAVPNNQALADLVFVRSNILPKIAELTVTALPKEQFPKTTLETFPNKEEQAKLVRNMITSLIFRGNPIPYISIDELIKFAKIFKSNYQAFLGSQTIAEIGNIIADKLRLSGRDAVSYIFDLCSQVREAFGRYSEGYPRMASNESEAGSDRIYRAFKDTLLLLHPAIEEEKLITDPAKVQNVSGEYSLWRADLSEVIESFRVPTLDGIYRALRLAEAEGYKNEELNQAVEAWHNYRRRQKREESRVKRLSDEIGALNHEIERIKNPESQLPRLAEWIMRTFHRRDEWDKHMDTKSVLRRNESIINQSKEKREMALAYVNGLMQGNSGCLPAEARIPEWIIEQKRKLEESRPERVSKTAKGMMDRAIGDLSEDFLIAFDPTFEEKIRDIDSLSVNAVKNLSDTTQSDIERLEENNSHVVSVGQPINVTQILEYINMTIEDYRSEFAIGHGRKKTYLKEVGKLISVRRKIKVKNEKGLYVNTTGIPKEFFVFCLKRRKDTLDKIAQAKTRMENIPGIADIPSTWKKSEIEDWIREVEISTLPADIIPDLVAANVSPLEDLLGAYYSGAGKRLKWPKIIPDRIAFIDWAKEVISSSEDMLRTIKARDRDYVPQSGDFSAKTLGNHMLLLSALIKVANNPLFPSGEGLTIGRFMSFFSKRVQIAQAMLSNKEMDQIAENAPEFDSVQRNYYNEYLAQKKTTLEEELSDIQTNPSSVAIFIKRMKGLNLVMEEPPS